MFSLLKKIADKFHIVINLLNRKASPSTKQTFKHSPIGGDIIGRNQYNITDYSSNVKLSKLEKMVLKYLYLKHAKDNLPKRDNITKIYSELEIKDGADVRTLNDSKYLKVDGPDIVMTSDEVRYMDNINEDDLAKVILPSEQKVIDAERAKELQRIEQNKIERTERRKDLGL